MSRHDITEDQHRLASEQNVQLVKIDDLDAYSVFPEDVAEYGDFDGVVVVNPAAAMRLHGTYDIGVFRAENRAEPGSQPDYRAVLFQVY
jgi:hypothetical protein